MGGTSLAPITAQQFLANMIAYAQANSALTGFEVGDPERAILEAVAIQLADQSLDITIGLQQAAIQGALTAFGFPALPPAFATGTETFYGAGGTSVPAGTQVSTVPTPGSPTVTFATTTTTSLPSGSGTQSVAIAISALVPGTASNVSAGALSTLVTAVPGISSVTNLAAITNGADQQTQAQQAAAFGAFVEGLQEGTGPALLRAALSVSGVAQAAVVTNPSTVCLTVTSAGAVTDNSAEANLPWGAPFQAFATSPSIGDAFVVGAQGAQFSLVYINLSTAGSGLTGSWEYYGSSGWASLSVTDGTDGLSQTGTVVFTPPTGWTATTIGDYFGYFIRYVLSSASYTTMAKVNHVFLLNPPPGVADVVVANGANTITNAILDAVSTATDAVRDPGLTVNVVAATLLTQDVTAAVTVAAGYAQTTVAASVVTALTQYLQGLGIGASATVAAMTSVCFQVPGVTNVAFDPPTDDVNVPNTTLIVPGTVEATTTQA